MRKLLTLLFIAPLFCVAQDAPLQLQGKGSDLYLNHMAQPHENFYSIGRMYNISPKEIGPYNNLSIEKGLNIGQTIKIPLRASNFSATNKAGVDEVTVPLYRQSAVAGYLKVKKDVSALAKSASSTPVQAKTETPKKQVVVNEAPYQEPTVIPVVTKKESTKPVSNPVLPVNADGSRDFSGGIFKSEYSFSGKEESGTAGIFKSTSGWDDGKYYCLYNKVDAGTIIKITNPATGKFVYARVLDVIPDLKQNADLLIRVSNAAADVLGAGTANFTCSVSR